MNGPKHLWSGDWERESEAGRPRHDDDTQHREPVPPEQPPPHRRSMLLPALVIGAVALITGAAFGLSALVHSNKHHSSSNTSTAAAVPFPQVPTIPLPQVPTVPQTPQQTAPPGGTTTQTRPTPTTNSSPIIYWQGMQIETVSPGNVVIDTVQLHSEADSVNLDPGEQLLTVNGHAIHTTTDIVQALRGAHRGQLIPVQVSYGSSSPSTVELPLGNPPRTHP